MNIRFSVQRQGVFYSALAGCIIEANTQSKRKVEMKKCKWYPILIVGLILLLSSWVIGCGQSKTVSRGQLTFTTYVNGVWDYSISYPQGWALFEPSSGTVNLIPPGSDIAIVTIIVSVRPGETVKEVAENWGELIFDHYELIIRRSEKMSGMWDWHVFYIFMLPDGVEIHGDAYFKKSGENLYILYAEGTKAEYETYPFHEVISTFQLLEK